MSGITTDSAKVLTEKLSLSRELAALKPELEHLRSQALSQQTILGEKLSLQRQVSTLEVELETEKRASRRAVQKIQTSDREGELQNQLDTMQKDLVRERREMDKERRELEMDFQNQLDEAQKALVRERKGKDKVRKELETELQNQVEELQKELAREKRGKEKACEDSVAELQGQVEELQKELLKQKRGKDRARKNEAAELQNQVGELQKELIREKQGKANSCNGTDAETQNKLRDLKNELAHEKQEREHARKEAEKNMTALQSREALLESKLDQFQIKLRTTKEQLKGCQADLNNALATIAKSAFGSSKGDPTAKKERKRGALEMSTDVGIGTPDGVAGRGKRPPVKRGRVEQTMVGEKSMFSITPFLNRTINIASDTPDQDTNLDMTEEEKESEETEVLQRKPQNISSNAFETEPTFTPSAVSRPKAQKKASAKSTIPGSTILGESKANEKIKKLAAKKPTKRVRTLEKVIEEGADEKENPEFCLPVPSKELEKSANAPALKSSKVQPRIAEVEDGAKKKKRKLGGGKTLFDEDDGETTKRPAQVALGPRGLLGKGRLPGPKAGGIGVSSAFGAFSPLKKDRRGVGASFLA